MRSLCVKCSAAATCHSSSVPACQRCHSVGQRRPSIGAVKFVRSTEARDSIVKLQKSDHGSAKLARIDQLISEAEQRIALMRRSLVRLANSGADTSVAERVVATTIRVFETMRSHRQMSARLGTKSLFDDASP